jgi:cytochrome c oxidase subunit 1
MGWDTLNMVATVGAVLMVVGGAMLLYNVVASYLGGAAAGDNPWNADTLEWATSSPPPVYNFLHIPVVEGRHALWQRSADAPILTGLRADRREVVVCDVMDGQPVCRTDYPEPSIWPFLCAVVTSAFFIGSIFTAWAVPVAILPLAITLIGWFWPKGRDRQQDEEDEKEEREERESGQNAQAGGAQVPA